MWLFEDAVCSSDYIPSNDTTVNDLERIWKEAVVATFQLLSIYLRGKTEKNRENFVRIVYIRAKIRNLLKCMNERGLQFESRTIHNFY